VNTLWKIVLYVFLQLDAEIHSEVNVLNKTTKRSAVSSDEFSGEFVEDDAIFSWHSQSTS
jgi:hypothetical protein